MTLRETVLDNNTNGPFVAIVIICIAFFAAFAWIWVAYQDEKKMQSFAEHCGRNKGIAVRDLSEIPHCVPTFSALAEKKG